jgi:hypothetical protein
MPGHVTLVLNTRRLAIPIHPCVQRPPFDFKPYQEIVGTDSTLLRWHSRQMSNRKLPWSSVVMVGIISPGAVTRSLRNPFGPILSDFAIPNALALVFLLKHRQRFVFLGVSWISLVTPLACVAHVRYVNTRSVDCHMGKGHSLPTSEAGSPQFIRH